MVGDQPEAEPVLLFDLGSEAIGVRLRAVREIGEAREVDPVPLAPRAIRGLMDVRGRMVTVVDLPHLLGHPVKGGGGYLLILAEPRDRTALWCPTVVGLQSLDLRDLRPRRADDPVADLFEGYVATERMMLNLLSPDRVLLRCEQEVLQRYRAGS